MRAAVVMTFAIAIVAGCARAPQDVVVRGVGEAPIVLADPAPEGPTLPWATDTLEASALIEVDESLFEESPGLACGSARLEARDRVLASLAEDLAGLEAAPSASLREFAPQHPSVSSVVESAILNAEVEYSLELVSDGRVVGARGVLPLAPVAEAVLASGGGFESGSALQRLGEEDRRTMAELAAQREALDAARRDLAATTRRRKLPGGETVEESLRRNAVLAAELRRAIAEAEVIESRSNPAGDTWRTVLEADISRAINNARKAER